MKKTIMTHHLKEQTDMEQLVCKCRYLLQTSEVEIPCKDMAMLDLVRDINRISNRIVFAADLESRNKKEAV